MYRELTLKLNKNYFIRTSTMYYAGTLRGIDKVRVKLIGASWRTDSSQFKKFMRTGVVDKEQRCFSSVEIPIDEIINITACNHPLQFKGDSVNNTGLTIGVVFLFVVRVLLYWFVG